MERPYKNILLTAVSLSALSLLLLGNNWVNDNIWRTVLSYTTGGIVFTFIYGLVIGAAYYIIKRKGTPYNNILLFSVLLMLFLFAMDTFVWDVPVDYSLRRSAFEWLVYGTVYVGIFFGTFSAIYYILNRSFKYLGKLTGLKK